MKKLIVILSPVLFTTLSSLAGASPSVSCIQIISSNPVYQFDYSETAEGTSGTLSANWAELGKLSCVHSEQSFVCGNAGNNYTVKIQDNGIAAVSLLQKPVMTLSCYVKKN